MFSQAKYDFSRESSIKPGLLKKVKKEHRKLRQLRLSDDELDLVVAAGDDHSGKPCPLTEQTCESCDKFRLGTCTAGYTKGGG